MTATFVNTVTGFSEERPTTAEIVRARFSDLQAPDVDLFAAGQRKLIAELDERRARSRELLVPLILECLDRLDTVVGDDDLLIVPMADMTEYAVAFDDADVEEILTTPRPIEQLLGLLRSYLYQTITNNTTLFLRERMLSGDPRVRELSQQRIEFLRHFPDERTSSRSEAAMSLFSSGFGTANDMAWDIARALPVAHQRQFGTGIDVATLSDIVGRAQNICEPLASMHQHDFVAMVSRMKHGRTPPKIDSDFNENAFADPDYFWLAQKDDRLSVELTEQAFPLILNLKVISGHTCPGKGKAIQRVLRRVAALCRRYLPPHMSRINDEVAKEVRATE